MLNDCICKPASNSNEDPKFIAIPNLKNPRIITSLSNYKLYKIGLNFHNTASLKNIIIKEILKLSFYPLQFFHKNSQCTYTNTINELLRYTQDKLNTEKLIISSFYIGTEKNANRKITLQLCDVLFRPVGILKIPLENNSCDFIQNEFTRLQSLRNIALNNFLFPQKCFWVKNEKIEALFEEDVFADKKQISLCLDDRVVNSSIELAVKSRKNVLDNYFNKLKEGIHKINLSLNLLDLIESNIRLIENNNVPVVLTHGDFVKYNIKKKDNNLAIVDWEFSREGLPLYDLFHFIFQGFIQIKKSNLRKAIKKLFSNKNVYYFKKYLDALEIDHKLIKTLFIIYLVDYLLFDIKLKPHIRANESQYFKTLELIVNKNL